MSRLMCKTSCTYYTFCLHERIAACVRCVASFLLLLNSTLANYSELIHRHFSDSYYTVYMDISLCDHITFEPRHMISNNEAF